MEKHDTESSCSGDCAEAITGIRYTCPECGRDYCYTCAYYSRFNCPKCGTRLT